MQETSKYDVPALIKTDAILQYLSAQQDPCTLTEICNKTGLAKSTVFTLLGTLEELRYIRKEDNAYSLGIRLYTMGSRALEQAISPKSYRPTLERLCLETGFTVHLCMYDQGRITVLDKLDGSGIVQFKAYKGQSKRLNTSAGGKALAAFLPEKELKNVIDAGFDHFTTTSISNVDAFLRHLSDIRQVGYSIDEGEGEVGVRCLGAPVFLCGGQIFGGISLTTISSQLPLSEICNYIGYLLKAAEDVSRALAYAGPYPLPICDPTKPHPYIAQIETLQNKAQDFRI